MFLWEKPIFVFALLVLPLGVAVIYPFYSSRRNEVYPPCRGWIPWLGCAVEFGKAPLYFIEESRRKLGPVFTLKVAGKRLTFVTEPEDFQYFFSSDAVDFQKAVQKPVKNTASISEESFFEIHQKVHDTIKGELAPPRLETLCEKLNVTFAQQITKWGKAGKGDLMIMVRSSMYISILDTLFGEHVLPTSNHDSYLEFEAHFVKFDEQFEHGTEVPEIVLRQWSKSKRWLLRLFDTIVNREERRKTTQDNQTLLQAIIRTVDRPHAPNYALLMMWAALANAIPITFWVLVFIYSDREILTELLEELRQVVGYRGKELADLRITQDDLQKMPKLKWCVLEAIRLRGAGVITRGVTRSFTLRGYTIPPGDMLMLSPYWAHRNEETFPYAESFVPNRWSNADLAKNQFLKGFLSFGGGRYQCPGRWFGLMEIHLFVAMVIYKYDMKLMGPVPEVSMQHLVGSQQPERPATVEYTLIG
ncbi:24-hydroxycholesterol 7-alpha-hydroxylase [Lamellibrachia satsuma]|nr:24-hydroxycholesterol 7-alpha-hydroxylase [Lamellibrachia satsuma]